MTRDEFWNIIEQARHSVGRSSDVPGWLEETLSQLPENEIVDFGGHFHDCRDAAFDARLWLAAVIILGGCSDDSFDYFRGWLISQGRKVFEAALADPDSIAGVECLDGDDGYPRLERMLSVDSRAYCQRTGEDRYDFGALQRYEALCPRRPAPALKNRQLLSASSEQAAGLLPRLAAKFQGGMRSTKLK